MRTPRSPSPRRYSTALAALAAAVPVTAQCGIVADLTPGNVNNNIDGLVCAFGEELYFRYFSAISGSELWKWTAQNGAQIVVDLAPGAANSGPEHITPCGTALGPRVFYSGFEIGHGHELYASDGTAAGTGRVREIRSGSGSSLPFDFAASGGKVFFNARDGSNGEELWVSDGTSVGTIRLSDFAPGSGNGRPNSMIDLDGVVVFSAYDPTIGRELFISDGTPAGTQLLLDIELGPTASDPADFTRVGDLIYFVATTSAHGRELWKTDGTANGTVMIADTFKGNSVGPVDLCACGDRLFFHEWAGSGVGGIYVTDGTAAGTVDLGAVGNYLTCSGNRVFFQGFHFLTGSELWTSDGTAAGTTLLCQLDPGGNANPDLLTMCRGRLFMNAYDPNYGRELIGIQTPGASKALLGVGGGSDHPTLRTTNGAVPVFGTTVGIEGEGPVGYTGVLLAGGPGLPSPVPAIPGFIDGGYDWVGLQAGTSVTVTTLFSQSFSVPFMIPNNTVYEGLLFNFQTVWFHPTAQPTLQVSNGLQLVLGAAVPH